MDSYDIDAIKIEKAKAMRRYQCFRKFATILRSLEILFAVVLITWSIFCSSEYLSTAVEASCIFLRRSFSLLFCPHFVFLLGNIIIITILANSRGKEKVSYASGEMFSGEFPAVREPEPTNVAVEVPYPEPESAIVPAIESREPEIMPQKVKEIREVEAKCYLRTQSALQKVIGEEREKKEKQKIELRRSKTVPRQKSVIGESAMAEGGRRRRSMYDVDDLSNEEFRRRVEAFIEKQQRFLREEESNSVVLTN